ncbi:arginine repressor [Rosenbergiella australiborealis]|uniref:Arginine repressor n=1 Tax=Rosenbergiella australiborealis TaxID=1544696 RepID=A0ABS5T0N4_9GAMM|nr:ArgR family transcriptional regulator [Rosenbergiella australiborealis]MBT0725894.1 ArgR family transcriptional regulator [Rosenbergiella australiborealis]
MERKGITEKELLNLCQRLITQGVYTNQTALQQALAKRVGSISLATISRLLHQLGVVKIQNARGQRIYAIDGSHQPSLTPQKPLAEMVLDIVSSESFVLVQTAPGYSQAIARLIDCQHAEDILGVVAGNDNVWIAPKDCQRTPQLCRGLRNWLLDEGKSDD